MARFRIKFKETVYKEVVVDASSEYEAKQIVKNGDSCEDEVEIDTDGFEIEEVEEI